MSKIINIDVLDEQSLNRAIQELEEYRIKFEENVEVYRMYVAEVARKYVDTLFSMAKVDDLVRTGTSRQAQVSVTVEHGDTISTVIAVGQDAVFVEFGAGVYHNGSAGSSPHPMGAKMGYTIGGYGEGRGKYPIWYFKDEISGEVVSTHGTPAQMPMYNAMLLIRSELQSIARRVFQ